MDGEYVLECRWRGLHEDDTSWESFDSLFKEIPDMIIEFLKTHADTNASAKYLLNKYLHRH